MGSVVSTLALIGRAVSTPKRFDLSRLGISSG